MVPKDRVKVSAENWVEEAWHQHREAVLRYLIVHTDLDSAEDALIDVFAIALGKSSETPDSQIAWLLGIARNVAHEHRRIRHKVFSIGDLSELSHSAAKDYTDQVHESDLIVRAFQILDEHERDILGLAFVQEVDAREIAKILGCSQAAYYTRLSRAKKKIAQILTELEEQE